MLANNSWRRLAILVWENIARASSNTYSFYASAIHIVRSFALAKMHNILTSAGLLTQRCSRNASDVLSMRAGAINIVNFSCIVQHTVGVLDVSLACRCLFGKCSGRWRFCAEYCLFSEPGTGFSRLGTSRGVLKVFLTGWRKGIFGSRWVGGVEEGLNGVWRGG